MFGKHSVTIAECKLATELQKKTKKSIISQESTFFFFLNRRDKTNLLEDKYLCITFQLTTTLL